MRPWTVFALATVLCAGGVRSAAAQSSPRRSESAPAKPFHFGVEGAGLISGSPGLAIGGVAAFEWNWLLLSADVALGETFSGWDAFLVGAHAGAALLPRADTPYLLAGFEHSIFVDFINEKRGRTDSELTGEVGYLFRRDEGVRQVWLAVRALVPVASHMYSSSAPELPVALLIVKLLW